MFLTLLAFLSLSQALPVTDSSSLWIGDWNGDGLPDVLHAPPEGPARLLENQGSGRFADISVGAGLPAFERVAQALFTDLDGDGRQDLLVVTGGRLALLAGGDGVLTERSDLAGLAELRGVAAVTVLDGDGDPRPDLLVRAAGGDRLLFQSEQGRFEPVELEHFASGPGPVLVTTGPELPRAEGQPAPEGEQPPGAGRGADRDGAGWGPLTGEDPTTPPAALQAGPSITAAKTHTYASAALGLCLDTILDQGGSGCLEASSVPVLGDLYPLSVPLNVDQAGRVGMGTTSPSHQLTVRSYTNDDTLRLIGSQTGYGYGAKLNFGDADYVHIWEYDDDRLDVHADREVLVSSYSGVINLACLNTTILSSLGTALLGGNVGIGTSFPAWALHIKKDQGVALIESTSSDFGSVLELRNSTPIVSVNDPEYVGAINFVDGFGSYEGQIAYHTDGDMTFRANNQETMILNGAGTLLLGQQILSGFSSLIVDGQSDFVGTVNCYGAMTCFGNLVVTGTKNFAQPHPTDPSKELRMACLEGNESGTYFRARAWLHAGRARIAVPEDFRLVSEPDELTVQLTPVGNTRVWIERYDIDEVLIGGDDDVEVHVLVNGIRRGYRSFETLHPNRSFVPEERGVPFGTQYPDDYRRILVGNGTLNADFTPNAVTATRLGWTLRDPAPPVETEGPLVAPEQSAK